MASVRGFQQIDDQFQLTNVSYYARGGKEITFKKYKNQLWQNVPSPVRYVILQNNKSLLEQFPSLRSEFNEMEGVINSFREGEKEKERKWKETENANKRKVDPFAMVDSSIIDTLLGITDKSSDNTMDIDEYDESNSKQILKNSNNNTNTSQSEVTVGGIVNSFYKFISDKIFQTIPKKTQITVSKWKNPLQIPLSLWPEIEKCLLECGEMVSPPGRVKKVYNIKNLEVRNCVRGCF